MDSPKRSRHQGPGLLVYLLGGEKVGQRHVDWKACGALLGFWAAGNPRNLSGCASADAAGTSPVAHEDRQFQGMVFAAESRQGMWSQTRSAWAPPMIHASV